MYRIGEFSILSKTTIKTLRYYENEKLLIPKYIDPVNNYRYYDNNQLNDISKIISLKQLGFSLKDIKLIMQGCNIKSFLDKRREEIISQQELYDNQLSKINYLLEEDNNMNNTIFMKELPECIVYYKEGIISNYSEESEFILNSGKECLELNPNIKCITPDYCFVEYLDGEYKENNIKVRYSQAVCEKGKENDSIKFRKLESVPAVCILHKGPYEDLGKSYSAVMNYIEKNGYEVVDYYRECYIDGIWNKEDPLEWLTEIQVPVKK